MDENARFRTLTDANGDGTAELYLGLTNGTMIAIDTETGTTGWTTTVSIGDTQVLSSPVLANVDRNGGSEVIAVSRAETVTVLDEASGGKLAAYERLVSIYTFPTPADIDAEDDEEVLVRYGDGRVVALEYTS